MRTSVMDFLARETCHTLKEGVIVQGEGGKPGGAAPSRGPGRVPLVAFETGKIDGGGTGSERRNNREGHNRIGRAVCNLGK